MNSRRRIFTIYRKELIDILRDRRTLLAMIVVPIVLYPLLTVGSIQAVTHQVQTLKTETIVVGVLTQRDVDTLDELFRRDVAALEREAVEREADSDPVAAPADPVNDVDYRLFETVDALEQSIRDRVVQVGVVFESAVGLDDYGRRIRVHIRIDREEIRSKLAGVRVTRALRRTGDRVIAARLVQEGLPDAFVKPFEITTIDLSTPQSMLGQILPLILVLMTITGAIYPAIDLTAGERERGTLETLMVCPVRVMDLIVGKFMVVTTVAIMGAALNLGSMTATVYFGGFQKMISSEGSGVPIARMLLILLSLIPFAVLMSAIMIAVCSYARTFKEAQNYVTPVILAVLIPGAMAALPTAQLEGIMLVMPVGNMVLLSREILIGAIIEPWQMGMVLLSTTLYAGAAVAVAASVFGKESVVFSDSGSLRAALSRRLIKPAGEPSMSMAMLVVALLYPVWFYLQQTMLSLVDSDIAKHLRFTAVFMPIVLVIVPVAILVYWKVDVIKTLRLRAPSPRYWLAALLLGISVWVPASGLQMIQERILPAPEGVSSSLLEGLSRLHPVQIFLFIAVVPAICEELLFRGFLLSGLRTGSRKWVAILGSAAIFALFHFMLFKLVVTGALGVMLAYLCWQSRSIIPAMLVHFLHNSIGALTVVWPEWQGYLGMDPADATPPLMVWVAGLVLVAAGLGLAARQAPQERHFRSPAGAALR